MAVCIAAGALIFAIASLDRLEERRSYAKIGFALAILAFIAAVAGLALSL